jgi:ABC-2 type transport system permease protein
MSGIGAMMYREARIRATNVTFIFWDVIYPLLYLFVFGVGMASAFGGSYGNVGLPYTDFLLAGVIGMASFGIASNTSWSLFMDRDNGIFYEMLTYPLSRGAYLIGKVLFNVVIGLAQAIVTVVLAAVLLDVHVRWLGLPLLFAAVAVGTAGWFFFYAIFALMIRRNDAFNTVTSIFYFVFLFASSMFYPIDPLPAGFRMAALANPITWQVDLLRFATVGVGDPARLAIEGTLFVVFTAVTFVAALTALRRQE